MKINGYGLASWSPVAAKGDAGLATGSLLPNSQYVVTNPFPFNSTSPLNSSLNVPNLSKIFLVVSLTCIFKAKRRPWDFLQICW
jgi:hypothetical protein